MLVAVFLIGLIATIPFSYVPFKSNLNKDGKYRDHLELKFEPYSAIKNPFLPLPRYGPFSVKDLVELRWNVKDKKNDPNSHFVLSMALRYWAYKIKDEQVREE